MRQRITDKAILNKAIFLKIFNITTVEDSRSFRLCESDVKNSKDLLEYIQYSSLSSCNRTLKHFTFPSSKQLFLTLT